MQPFCRKTFLFLTLSTSIQELKLNSQSKILEDIFLSVLAQKIKKHADMLASEEIKGKKKKKGKQEGVKALQVAERQFPLKNENSNVQKYQGVLYSLEVTPFYKQLQFKKPHVCLLECFSDNIIARNRGLRKIDKDDDGDDRDNQAQFNRNANKLKQNKKAIKRVADDQEIKKNKRKKAREKEYLEEERLIQLGVYKRIPQKRKKRI